MLKELLRLLKKGGLMDQAFQETVDMINVLEEMFNLSVRYLHEGIAPETDRDVYTMDKRINLLDQKMRRHIYNHLVLQEQKDLYMSLLLVQMGVDLERIGDYIKNIYDLRRISGDCDFGTYTEELHRLEDDIRKLIPAVREALQQNDDTAAIGIQKTYFEKAKLCDKRVEAFLTHETDTPPKHAVATALYYRYLKRVIAHFINVASAISNPYDRVGFHPDDII